MVVSCSAYNCTSRYQKGNGIRFYVFPLSKPDLLKKWLVHMKRDKWTPSHHDRICSKHFTSDCFRVYVSSVQLCENAVPTVFDFPEHLQPKKQRPRRQPITRPEPQQADGVENTPQVTSPFASPLQQSNPGAALECHTYALLSSPRGIKRKYEQMLSGAIERRQTIYRKLKNTRRRLFRIKKRLQNMSDIIRELKSRHDIGSEAVSLIERCFGEMPAEILKRKLKGKSHDVYSEAIRSFALTLHFYSPKAYEFVRRSFANSLPHVATLRRWASSVDGKPGFTRTAFECLEKMSKATGKHILCSLIFDEMSIRKHLQWTGTQLEGYVDIGTGLTDDSLPVASEVLLFLIVPLNGNWKIPIAYFLIDGMSADEKCNFVSEAIIRLHAVNVTVVSVICDGPSTNFAMASRLGAAVTAAKMEPSFPHPCVPDSKVHIIFDACHMLKLMRNTLAEKGVLTDGDGNQIRWQYIKDLFELQDKEGLKAANKLKRNHIEWYQQKMKLSLAAQALSSSVADSLEFVSKDLQLKQFADVDATVKFIRIIDRLFHVLNSKLVFAKGYKAVLRTSNEHYWRPFLMEAKTYLLQLKLADVSLHSTPRKTTVLGFVATITSVVDLYDSYVKTGLLTYLATYRLSQDHIELTFNVIRSRGRWNNNPTCGQFRSAYRHLLLKHDVTPSNSGNAVAQESLNFLCAMQSFYSSKQDSTVSCADLLSSFGLHSNDIDSDDHSYCILPDRMKLTEFASNVITYMAGYVARKLCLKLKCTECKLLLMSTGSVPVNCKLIKRKDRGGLIVPSSACVTVCTVTEKCIRYLCASSKDQLPRQRNVNLALQLAVIERVKHLRLFSDDCEHSCNVDFFESRELNVIRMIVNLYVNVRFYFVGKQSTDRLRGKNVRHQSTKQVLFAHQ